VVIKSRYLEISAVLGKYEPTRNSKWLQTGWKRRWRRREKRSPWCSY